MASQSNTTRDHDTIRKWAEERNATPSTVASTRKEGDVGLIRLNFPGFSGEDSLEEITWEEFFDKFDQQGLALVYQEKTADGEVSNFNKLVSGDSVDEDSSPGTPASSSGSTTKKQAAKKTPAKAAKKTAAKKTAAKKVATKKAPAKKTAVKKVASKKAAPKKAVGKKAPAKKATAKKAAVKKSAAKKAPAKKKAVKKTARR